MVNRDLRKTAKKRVNAKIGFYIHLCVFFMANILMVVLNLTYSPQYHWFYWPLLGWGIGLFFHSMGVFFFASGSALKEKMIENEEKKLMTDVKQ